MAVIVGQYIVTANNKNFTDFALGMKYPYSMTGNTFELAYDNLTQLKANLKNLLSTKVGERLGNPLFGTRLHFLVFEPSNETLDDKIYEEIERVINFWIPQVTIAQINISAENDIRDRGEVFINIVFQANYNNELFDVDFKVSA